jgi:hypothetical protein
MNIVMTPPEIAHQSVRPMAGVTANDAFSFWKLPEDWRAGLGPNTVEYSRMISEWYLLERYGMSENEDARLSMSLYYAIKDFIPVGARHLARSLLFRLRRQLGFPKWPCEDALIVLLWVQIIYPQILPIKSKGIFHQARSTRLFRVQSGSKEGELPGSGAVCYLSWQDIR